MVPRGLGDGSIIGTTVLSSQQPQNQHQSQPQHSGTVSRQVKGILKRAPVNPNQESVQQPLSGGSASMASTASTAGSSAGSGGGALSQNKWDYELSPSSTDTTNKSEQHGGLGHGGQHGHGGHGHGLHHHHHHVHGSGGSGGGGGGGGGGNRGEPDILQLPMGLPPPPGTSAISGNFALTFDIKFCNSVYLV